MPPNRFDVDTADISTVTDVVVSIAAVASEWGLLTAPRRSSQRATCDVMAMSHLDEVLVRRGCRNLAPHPIAVELDALLAQVLR